MLDTFRRGQRWLTGLFIFVIGGVFVFFLGLGGPMSGSNQPTGDAVIEVGDIRISRADFYRAREAQIERFKESLGDQLDSKGAAAFIDSQTMGQLVDSVVVTHAAEEMGLQVTREEIQSYLRSAPQFRDAEGRFATDVFEDWVEYSFGSQRAFLTLMRQDLLRAKLRRLIYNQPVVTEAEARAAALHRLEGVQIGYVALDTEALPPDSELPDADVELYLTENEGAVRATFEERVDLYRKPEARKSRHILFRVTRDADDEDIAAARQKADDALARIQGGAAFEDVALELSEDEGSKTKGGDIGFVVRGEAMKELEEGVYSLEPGGELSIVQTESGFHVLRVDEEREASDTPFEEVSLKIARELAGKKLATSRAEDQADEIAAAVRDGQSLADAAQAAGVPYEQTTTFKRRADGYVPDVGISADLMATAFALTPENRTSPRVFSIDSKRTLIELIERDTPDESILEEEVLAEKDRLLDAKRGTLMKVWAETHRQDLKEQNALLINSDVVTSS